MYLFGINTCPSANTPTVLDIMPSPAFATVAASGGTGLHP
jgi:hypothetical protein